MKHIGDLKITEENEGEFKDLVEVTGNVYISGSATLEALETVGGNVNVYGSATLEAPKLETVGGYVYVSGSATLEALETVGGDVYVSGSATLEALETVGGYVYVSGSATLEAPNLKYKNSSEAKAQCQMDLFVSFYAKGFILINGILSWLLSEKRVGDVDIFKIQIVGKLEASFAVSRGDKYSHGKTVEKAIEDLRFKISSRDKSKFEKWVKNPKKKVSIDKAIEGYRVITGACEYGVRQFVSTLSELPQTISPKEVLDITKEQFGNNELQSFIERHNNDQK